MSDPDVKLLIALVLLVALGAAGWYFRDEFLPRAPEPVATEPVPDPAPEPDQIGPVYPIAPLALPQTGDGRLAELPPLDDSDAYFLLALGDVFGTEIEALLASEGLIDRFVASVDNLPRATLSEKIRAVGRLSDPFRVDTEGNGEPIYLSSDNFKRYDPLVGMVASADMNLIVDTYRRFYPLLQQSYERLGYPNAHFNDRVVEVIDHLLETPEPDEPIQLLRPHVLYEFADPELEALSSGQKLLLRIGPQHIATLKALLRRLRTQLTTATSE